jgi:hypothetical protein
MERVGEASPVGVSRKILHEWRKAWGLHGPAGLNRKRGPAKPMSS